MCPVFQESYHFFIHLEGKSRLCSRVQPLPEANLEAPPAFSVSFDCLDLFIVFVHEPCKQVIKRKVEIDYTHTVKHWTRLQ